MPVRQVGSLTAEPDNDVKAVIKLDPRTGERDTTFALEGVGDRRVRDQPRDRRLRAVPRSRRVGFVARYGFDGLQHWKRDTSGSSQSVEVHDGELLVGGHFRFVGDQSGDDAGFKSDKPATLNPHDECIAKAGTASYSLTGELRAGA